MEGRKDGMPKTMSLRFSSKGGGQKKEKEKWDHGTRNTVDSFIQSSPYVFHVCNQLKIAWLHICQNRISMRRRD